MLRLPVLLALATTGVIAVTGASAAWAGLAGAAEDGAASSSLVEDFSYPGAARIEASRGIKLLKGDGHIVLQDCGSDPDVPPRELILVQTSEPGTPAETNFCFRATGSSGFLTMEIGSVYFIRGEQDRTIDATIKVDEVGAPAAETEQVDPGEWQPVGIGEGRGPATLLELRFP